MIVFDLKCTGGHQFEAWFRSSDDYEDQIAHGEVECPYCGDIDVSKAVMAPNVGSKGNRGERDEARRGAAGRERDHDGPREGEPRTMGLADLPAPLRAELNATLEKVRKHVVDNCEYVGGRFPEEARKIHYGEAEERGIYGEATIEESLELDEEGIAIMPLPGLRKPGPTDA